MIRRDLPILKDVTDEKINDNYILIMGIIEKLNDCNKCRKTNSEIQDCYRDYIVVDEGRIYTKSGPCPAHQKQAQRARFEMLIRNAHLSKRFISCNFSTYIVNEVNKSAFQACKSYAESYPNDSGLFLYGPPGTGKTHLAVSVLQEILKKRHKGLFFTVPDLFDEIRQSFVPGNEENNILEKVKNAEFLVLDDLGAEKSTEFVIEKLYQIINSRYNDVLPTVITSNKTITEIAELIGTRAASRLRQMSYGVQFSGMDYRLHVK